MSKAVNNTEISTQVKEGMKEGLNLQEISWCETYLRTLSIKQACSESGLKLKDAQEMLNKEVVIKYIITRSDQYRNALEREKSEELTRDKISKVLETIILDPLASLDNRLRAIGQLNSIKEFDRKEGIKPSDEEEEAKPKISAEEAEILLKKIREQQKTKSKSRK
jgi:hypothetical protein